MRKIAVNFLLLIALALPVALFMLTLSHFHINVAVAAAVAAAAGWALNLTWAFAADSQNSQNYRSVAARFGWVCPAILVLLAWAVWRFMLNRTA
jgi:hypothetical protein